jgi:hypothetical protein
VRDRSFRLVWAGESLSLLGDTGFEVAFAWLVLTQTRSPAALGAVLLATASPTARRLSASPVPVGSRGPG